MPNALKIDGKTYPIRTDFRAGIEYQALAAAGKLTAANLYSIWFTGPLPDDPAEAAEGVQRFYRRKDEPHPENIGPGGPIPYDFTVDADVIISAFQRAYGIDLTDPEATMHWWRFMALLEGLYTYGFADRVGFRVQDLSGLDAKTRGRLLKKRGQFAILHSETTEDHLAQLDDIIAKHGGGTDGGRESSNQD